MNFKTLSASSQLSVQSSLEDQGLCIEIGSFLCRVTTNTKLLCEPLLQLYGAYPASTEPNGLVDFRANVRSFRKQLSPQAEFQWEGVTPFPSLPLSQCHPLFEWGMNWAIATLSGCEIVIHAAVVEKKGYALVLPGEPGSGKSTLCAALALSDWRLLSDELTIIDRTTHLVHAFPRPISLKDQSIPLIRSLFPDVFMTKPVSETRKGDIAYVRPPDKAVQLAGVHVPIGSIVFPKFQHGAKLSVKKLTKAYALAKLLENTFNVGLLGKDGFLSAATAISNAACFEITYGDLDDVMTWLDLECVAHS